jgi:hypothetical protein
MVELLRWDPTSNDEWMIGTLTDRGNGAEGVGMVVRGEEGDERDGVDPGGGRNG